MSFCKHWRPELFIQDLWWVHMRFCSLCHHVIAIIPAVSRLQAICSEIMSPFCWVDICLVKSLSEAATNTVYGVAEVTEHYRCLFNLGIHGKTIMIFFVRPREDYVAHLLSACEVFESGNIKATANFWASSRSNISVKILTLKH